MNAETNGPQPIADPAEDDTVARLLRAAGNRPPVPSEDAAIVKAAARAEWQQTVRMERQKRRFTRLAGGLLAAAAAAILVLNTGVGDSLWRSVAPPVAQIATVTGKAVTSQVMIVEQNLHSPGDKLWAKDIVATASDNDTLPVRMVLQMASGASVRLDAGTRLLMQSSSALKLESGTVYVDSQGAKIELQTDWGMVTNVGTRYEVSVAPDKSWLRVRVREGAVQLADSQAKLQTISAGEELMTTADEPIVNKLSPCGPEWQWTQDTRLRAPFNVEEPLLHDALSWAAAEGGWELKFASRALAANIASTTVFGDIKDGSLEEALQVWTRSSNLSYRIEECVLHIE